MILLDGSQRMFMCNAVARSYLHSQSLFYDDCGVLRCRTASRPWNWRRGLDDVGVGGGNEIVPHGSTACLYDSRH